ncbi:MAG: hypothetical protein PHV82_18945 [Victivallaceae bacterium]|nr:hypothetical protein [Victivallaceae bacterium]
MRKVKRRDNLYDISSGLDQYRGFVVSEISAITDTVEFTNGHKLEAGEAAGDVNETMLRRIQIREAIKAHFEKEKVLYHQGIKVLTLFFIDEVAKYRVYTEEGEKGGEYARIFEEEYQDALSELMTDMLTPESYRRHLDSISVEKTHNGYFSKDREGHIVDAVKASKSEKEESTDQSAYDLILKDKERLLSFSEPVRFIFSHSALREGWDNPNVFVICTLKHSDNTISRRQEVGRGLRIAVNQQGERQDNPITVHQTNVLTVVASESYKDFVSALQTDISKSLSERPHVADVKYFTGKIIQTPSGNIEVTKDMAAGIEFYLIQNSYVDRQKHITEKYHEAVKTETLCPLPDDLKPYSEQVHQLIASIFSSANLPGIDNDRNTKTNPLNANFEKREFKELWNRINHKAVYSVKFDSMELVGKCFETLNRELKISPLQYTIQSGEQLDDISFDQMKAGEGFKVTETSTKLNKNSIHSAVKYDLIGKICENVQLTRRTVAKIMMNLEKPVFAQFRSNPENFISEASRLINEQKATVIIEHLTYDPLTERHGMDIFTDGQSKQDFSNAGDPLKHHIYDYVITDSKVERKFVEELDTSAEVVVYAKLPKGFYIPTPVGNYNPDWAISFKEGTVKHIYFVAETKGSMSSLELREVEKTKIECARRFFYEINRKISPGNVKYDVVNSYSKLMEIVSGR